MVQNPGRTLSISRTPTAHPMPDALARTPSWCAPGMEWAFAVGRLLRSAIVGEDDYTFRHLPLRTDFTVYDGMRSTWFKRRFGLTISSEGIGQEPTPISPWLTELLLRLLQWPGIDITGALVEGFDDVSQPSDLLKIVKARLRGQGKIYGTLSKLPVYRLTMRCADDANLETFRVAVVQSLLPEIDDFCRTDITQWTPAFRTKIGRAHV